MAIPSPRPDNSGGFVLLQYTNGTYTHKQRLHVAPFASAASGGNNTRTYSPALGGSRELDVVATVTAYAALWQNAYTSAWTLSLLGLWQIQSGAPVELFPVPIFSAVNGTAGSGEAAEPELSVIMNMRTSGGGRFRCVLIATSGLGYGAPEVTTSNAAGNYRQKLVAYFTGTATAVVGHDGYQPVGTSHTTFPYNRKLRRHYLHA